MSVADIFETMDFGPAPEGEGQAVAWIESHGGKFGHFINGEFTKPAKLFETCNPARDVVLGQVSQGSKADVDRAVDAARKALGPWQKLSGFERAKYLYALARLVQKNSRLFAVLESLDNGKPIRETRDIDIPLAARHFYHHAGWAQMLNRDFPDHQAYGVCGQIIPWNFPLLMLSWKIAPALAAGNTVVLKPAEATPLTALLFAQICQQAGLPKGVVNIVTGDGDTGQLIVAHQGIDKIAFTGSTDVGKAIRVATAGTGKGLSLELGGKSPYIVFEDADIDSAVEGLVDAIWFNQGQVCCAGSRLLVQESIEKKFIAKLKRRMKKLRIGDPLDKAIDMGAMIDAGQVARVNALIKQGVDEGGTLFQGEGQLPAKGCYIKPTLFTDVGPADTIVREEIFGPVLVAMNFRSPEDAIKLANNSRYGLAASVWSEDINLALHVAPQLKCGIVWINSTNQMDAACGFGGYRESGFGREGGKEGMASYLKPAWLGGLKALPEPKKIAAKASPVAGLDHIDRTAKNYVGGKQARPDSGYDDPVFDSKGKMIGEVGQGSRKDIRNAVEAARGALGWAGKSAHLRAQILYYMAENLDYRAGEFEDRIRAMTGATSALAKQEVSASIQRLFAFAGWADKYDGAVHSPPSRNMVVAMVEPLGAMGILCPDEAPLLGLISLIAPAVAMGNCVVAVPSPVHPLAATDFYQVLETSDMPGGVVNIVTGNRDELAKTLAEHDGIDGLWYVGPSEGGAAVEANSIGNLKQVWTNGGKAIDWHNSAICEGDFFLAKSTQVKNVWVPYGV